jgi:WD40 repeat protein
MKLNPTKVFDKVISADNLKYVDELVMLLHSPHNFCSQSAWSPDAEHIVSVGWESGIQVWSPQISRTSDEFATQFRGVEHVDWSPVGDTILTGSFDGNSRVWEFPDMGYADTLIPQMARISDIEYSHEGSLAAISDHQDKINIFDVTTTELLERFFVSGVLSIDWSHDDSKLAAGLYDNSIRILDRGENRQTRILTEHSGNINDVKWSPDGKLLAAASEDGSISIWDTDRWEIVTKLFHETGPVGSLDWSPRGDLLASGGGNNNIFPKGDNALYLWSLTTFDNMLILKGHQDHIATLDWSNDGLYIHTCSHDGTLRIWGIIP